MKKYTGAFLYCTFALLLAGAANADGGFYLGGNAGIAYGSDIDGKSPASSFTNKLDPGLSLGLEAGYGFETLRLEGELIHQKLGYDKIQAPTGAYVPASGDMIGLSFLLNGYYDFAKESTLAPFVGVGLGLSKVEVDDLHAQGWTSKLSVDDTVFTYQISAGVGYALTETVTIDGRYRYLATSDPEFEGDVVYEFASHSVLIGIRFAF